MLFPASNADLLTVYGASQSTKLEISFENFRECSDSEPGTAGWEARTLPLCYVAPASTEDEHFFPDSWVPIEIGVAVNRDDLLTLYSLRKNSTGRRMKEKVIYELY